MDQLDSFELVIIDLRFRTLADFYLYELVPPRNDTYRVRIVIEYRRGAATLVYNVSTNNITLYSFRIPVDWCSKIHFPPAAEDRLSCLPKRIAS